MGQNGRIDDDHIQRKRTPSLSCHESIAQRSAAVFMVKNYSDNWHPIKNTKDLTMKQMFDKSPKLVSEQDEIYGVKTIDWENPSCKYLCLIGDEEIINLQRKKVYVFSDSVLCLGKIHENPRSNIAWEQRLEWFKSSPDYRTLDRIDGEPMEFEWNIFPGFNTLQLSQEVQELLLRLNETPETFTGRIIFMSMFNDISWRSKDNKKECESNAQLVSLLARRFGAGQWSFPGPGSEKKWYSICEDSPQGEWDKIAEKMMLTFAESTHPVFRSTSPLSRGLLKSKGGGKLSIHYCADQETITTVLRTIISANQLSLYGAVAEMCEEYESFHDRTGRPVVEGQSSSSFVPSVIKSNVPFNNDDQAHKDLLLQQYGERIEKLSQQDKLSKFCMDAGFLNVVEIGQYFMTKDTAEFSQYHAVARREYTLPRDEDTSEPKGWIKENTKIGPVLEVTTSYLQGKYGVEIRIMSMNQDNSHSWIRISHGLNKLVTNLKNNKQEISEVHFEEYALRLNAGDFACRSKAKAKPQRREPAGSSPRTVPIGEKTWTDTEPQDYSPTDYSVSKKLINLLRHGCLPGEQQFVI